MSSDPPERLQSIVARVDLNGRPNGTAFLVTREYAVTALHVLGGYDRAKLHFFAWQEDRTREVERCWRHPGGEDIAVLKLDRPAPFEVRLPLGDLPSPGDHWRTIGFPNDVVHAFHGELVEHPTLPVKDLSASLIQLHTRKGDEPLGGVSGAPCVVNERIVGLISFQLHRFSDVSSDPSGQDVPQIRWQRSEPSLQTLYALPISLLSLCPDLPADAKEIPEVVPEKGGIQERKIASSRIMRHASDLLFGRETELAALDATWNHENPNVYAVIAWGGVGKTALVAHWVSTRMEAREWPAVERYFDWSFYDQGTGESRQTSADAFFQAALEFFDDPDPASGLPWERGQRLAGLIRKHRTLLVLDGIEPLQYPPSDARAGQLTDPALEALLQGLAADNPGLCIVTSRATLTGLEGHAAVQHKHLDELAEGAAIALLRHLQVVGTVKELTEAWKACGGHALTIRLLGRFIAQAYEDRNVGHFREVDLEEADREHQGRSAFKVIDSYVRWLDSAGPERARELALLRLTGLFDRPMTRDCLRSLRARPAIPGLTDTIVALSGAQVNIGLSRLSAVDLLSVTPEAIDAHPIIREYFAHQLRSKPPEAFQAAHRRLFEYFKATPDQESPSNRDLEPLYQAVAHGCQAGLHQEAYDRIYRDRILRNTGLSGYYGLRIAGGLGSNLAALAWFFKERWLGPEPSLDESAAAALPGLAGYSLRGLGRLSEAADPLRSSMERFVTLRKWHHAALAARELAGLELTLGRIERAVHYGRRSVEYSDQGRDLYRGMPDRASSAGGNREDIDPQAVVYHCMLNRTFLAHALHQSGRREGEGGAEPLFREAERMQAEWRPEYPQLRWIQGFLFCELLLAPAERAAWARVMHVSTVNAGESGWLPAPVDTHRRAEAMVESVDPNDWAVDRALSYLALGRAALYKWLLSSGPAADAAQGIARTRIEEALVLLREVGHLDELPKGLLTRAWLRVVLQQAGADSDRTDAQEPLREAEADLKEAQEIAERGPMPLYLADIHLHRARLFRNRAELARASDLIKKHGYGRRKGELEDAEVAARHWPARQG